MESPFHDSPTVPLVAVPVDVDRAPEVGQSTLAVYRDGRFYLTGLSSYLRSVRISGVDATHRGFDFGFAQETFRDALIQVAHATGVISGRVAVESGGPAGGCAVIVFSTDRETWFTTSSYLGECRLRRMARSASAACRGDYYVAAVDPDGPVNSGEWQEPEALQALTSAARRVTLGDGEPYVDELRVVHHIRGIKGLQNYITVAPLAVVKDVRHRIVAAPCTGTRTSTHSTYW